MNRLNNDISYIDPSVDYLISVLCETENDIELISHVSDNLKTLGNDINNLRQNVEKLPNLNSDKWYTSWEKYEHFILRRGGALNELANVAQEYSDMEEFWEDYQNQIEGKSCNTIWDTYEHGQRRKLEGLLAKSYGSESALLLNSGMSAISVTIGMLKLSKNDVILTSDRCYFETSGFLEDFVIGLGVNVVRVDIDNSETVLNALNFYKPKLAIFETIVNVPDVSIANSYHEWLNVSPETIFLIDNSVQSHLTRWFEIIKETNDKILVLESAVKYITHACMAGVMYGTTNIMEKARNYARSSGQQLQQKAFNYICESEIRLVEKKLLIHSRNISIFKEELYNHLHLFEFLRSLDSKNNNSSEIFKKGCGSLLYLSLHITGKTSDLIDQMHRDLLKTWCFLAKELELNVVVRCGFGWNNTTARVYESGVLNQRDGVSYLRISIGIEPPWMIYLLAKTLVKAANQVIEKHIMIARSSNKTTINSMNNQSRPQIFLRAREWDTITAADVRVAQETFNEQGLYKSITLFAQSWQEVNSHPPRILDLCSSSGLAAFHIAKNMLVESIMLVDSDQDALDASREIFREISCPINIECIDAVDFIGKCKYDLILMNSAYHHIEDDRKVQFLNNAAQNLDKGGVIIVGDNFLPPYENNNEHLTSVEEFYSELINELFLRNASIEAIDVVATAGYYCWLKRFEYKVSWDIFLKDVALANLDLKKERGVWTPNKIDRKYGSIAALLSYQRALI
jgi:cystathionine beta-lyase/cystathionine gamma-synthase/SAM-dependent methyltransferase